MGLIKTFIKKHYVGIVIGSLLGIMLFVMVGSSLGDSAIRDELPHIAAGYSYLTTGDYRLNPEHPPLIKDMAGFSLLFLTPNFPYQFFYAGLNTQWDIGEQFLYKLGNNADLMLFWGRLPIILLSLLLGYFIYRFAKDLYGKRAGLFALFLYVFDANIIAHSRFVTTDLGIAAALFIHLYVLFRFLKEPTVKKLVLAGITFGIVLITKFSAALLLPIYFLLFIYLVWKPPFNIKSRVALFSRFTDAKIIKRISSYILSFGAIALIGVLLMYIFYIPHVANMPVSVQHNLVAESLDPGIIKTVTERMVDVPVLRPLAQYVLGFGMVDAHVAGGHTVYFLGQVGNGWWYYYPVAFLLKTAIPLMIFIGLTFIFWRKNPSKQLFRDYFLLTPVFVFFLVAMQGSLNLGIRYLLPIYPFLFVFVSKFINIVDFSAMKETVKEFIKNKKIVIPGLFPIFVTILLIWYALGSILVYPSYLAYFNEFAGGPYGGARYLTDSNIDWGQDLKRLAKYVEKNNISEIKIDYFGGGDINYYLGNKAVPWKAEKGRPDRGYLAVSASYYSQGATRGEYAWLKNEKPISRIGYSIYVYKFE